MLGIMRKYKQSFIIKGVFIIIVLSFVGTIFLIWGKGDEGMQGSRYAIKVNGEKIPYEEYARVYEQFKNSLQQMYGQPLTPEMEKQIGLRKRVIDTLVGAAMVQREAKRMGIKVSNAEVIADISSMPYFQKNGSFDKQQYEQVLKMNRISPSDFEESKRKEIMMRKARKAVIDEVKVSDTEAIEAYRKKRDKINLQFVSFAPAETRTEIKLTDKDLNEFLQKHEKEFRTQEEISLSYVILTPDKVASKVSVTSEEIKTFYEKNRDRYQGKEGILPFDEVKDRVKTDALKSKSAKHAYEMAADALNKNLKTADLTAAAQMLGSTVNDTSLFSMKAPPASLAGEAALLQKAFLLKQGELGGPLETAKGVYLFKIKTRNPSIVPPLAKVRSEVEKRVIAEKSADLARKKAADALLRLAKGGDNGTFQETGSFQYSEKGDIPKIGVAPELMEAVFLLTTTAPAPKSPFLVNGRWYAVRLKSRIETDLTDFKKEKRQIIQQILPRKQQEAVEKWLKDLKDKAKVVVNPALTAE
jgi:peptidyl-prolyl cis-trans isomerase D